MSLSASSNTVLITIIGLSLFLVRARLSESSDQLLASFGPDYSSFLFVLRPFRSFSLVYFFASLRNRLDNLGPWDQVRRRHLVALEVLATLVKIEDFLFIQVLIALKVSILTDGLIFSRLITFSKVSIFDAFSIVTLARLNIRKGVKFWLRLCLFQTGVYLRVAETDLCILQNIISRLLTS